MQIITHPQKENYPPKYDFVRDEIKNGDIVLYRGTSFLSKTIQRLDQAYYNHVGIVWRPADKEIDRVLTLDMWTKGISCVPLSRRMYGYDDFCIIRPDASKAKINKAISKVIEKWDGSEIKYDNFLLLRIAIIKKSGIDLTGLGKKDKFICSELVQLYCDLLGFDTYSFLNIISPEDFRRFADKNFEILFDQSPKPDISYYEKERKIKCLFGNSYIAFE
jgi:ribosomal protein S6